ncbi:TIR domain-containing protein [Streptomyces sp. NBC_00028]|uniref:toll/interleukin-1 receptor domain-containing protein n=1 Tax=Streptomyces sp. NBC_00028 TaxID=2975624 RepID=UPI003254FBB0
MQYSAFISYNHKVDSARARLLRQGLHQFARPWNRLRALRVFLDIAALSADHDLWRTIERALGDSEYLVLLASPESAESPWVGQEVTWWRQGPRPENLLIVVTGGELHWDHAGGDFDWERTDCLPEALRGHFAEEPRWVDLRWLGADHSGDLRDRQFRECVADVAATLHNRPKDELIGEDVSQRRRLRRFRRGMLAGMTALAVLASVAAVFAFVQRDTARDQARLATARQLAATALNLGEDDLEVASLLAVQAHQLMDTPETRSALYRLATLSPRLVRFVRADEPVTALALTGSRRYVAVGTGRGTVDVWSADGTRKVRSFDASAAVTGMTFSDDDQLLAVTTADGDTLVADPRSENNTPRRLVGTGKEVDAMVFHPFVHELVTIDSAGVVNIYDDKGAEPVERVRTAHGGAMNLTLLDEGSKLFVGYTTGWELYGGSGDRLTRIDSSDETSYPFNDYLAAASPHGLCFGFVKYRSVDLGSPADLIRWNRQTPDARSEESTCGSPPGLIEKQAEILAVSDDGRAAVGTSDGLLVTTSADEDRVESLETLTGVGPPTVLAFSPGQGDRLVSADGATVALWDLDRPGATASRPGVEVPDKTTISTQQALAVGPGGKLAWSHDSTDLAPRTLETWTAGGDPDTIVAGQEADVIYDAIAYADSGQTLYTATAEAVETWELTSASLIRTHSVGLPDIGGDFAGRTRIAARPDGRVAVVPADGSVLIVDPASGERKRAVAPRKANLTARDREKYAQAFYPRAVGERGGLAAVTTEDRRIDVYELPSGRRLHRLDPRGSSLSGLTLSERNHALYAVVDDGVLERWDTVTGELRWRSDGAGLHSLAADAEGQWVATLDGNGTLWLWDAVTGDRLGSAILPVPRSIAGIAGPGEHSSLAFSADGRRLWSATEGGELLSWATTVDAWTKEVCARVGRPLTGAERTRYLTSLSDGHTACAH